MSTSLSETAKESSAVMNNISSDQNPAKHDINNNAKIRNLPVSFSSKDGIEMQPEAVLVEQPGEQKVNMSTTLLKTVYYASDCMSLPL